MVFPTKYSTLGEKREVGCEGTYVPSYLPLCTQSCDRGIKQLKAFCLMLFLDLLLAVILYNLEVMILIDVDEQRISYVPHDDEVATPLLSRVTKNEATLEQCYKRYPLGPPVGSAVINEVCECSAGPSQSEASHVNKNKCINDRRLTPHPVSSRNLARHKSHAIIDASDPLSLQAAPERVPWTTRSTSCNLEDGCA